MMKRVHGGFTLVEVMVTVSIIAVGLLGLAGLQLRALNAEKESYARGQALLLVDEMAERILANKAAAVGGMYGDGDPASDASVKLGTGSDVDCSAPAAGVETDWCDWAESMRRGTVGLDAADNQVPLGMLESPIGCIAWTAATATYTISLSWTARDILVAAAEPAIACDVSEVPVNHRRTVIRTLRLPTLGA